MVVCLHIDAVRYAMRLVCPTIVLALLLPAIANAMGPAEREFRETMKRNSEASEVLRECRLNIGEAATTKIMNTKVITLNGKDPYKYELLTNNKKINQSQKVILRDFLALEQRCQAMYEDVLVGDAMLPLVRRMNSEKDSAYADLMTGKTSISEGNKRLIQAINDYIRDYDQTSRRMLERAENERAAYAQQDEARRIALIQSIDQSLARVRSIDTSPSQSFTNCSQNFNNINCSTLRY